MIDETTELSIHPAVLMLQSLGGEAFIDKWDADYFITSDNPQPRLGFRFWGKGKSQARFWFEISLTEDEALTCVLFSKNGDGSRNILQTETQVLYSNLLETFESMQR